MGGVEHTQRGNRRGCGRKSQLRVLGLLKSVVHIYDFIGPFWGRYGFRGQRVNDPKLVGKLLGRHVPRRQNQVTTFVL